jgi:peptide/nickel transport system substrate-binding protein
LLGRIKDGDMDIVGNLSLDLVEQVKGIPGVIIVFTPGFLWEHIDFNLDDPLFTDVNVRRAIALGIDRQTMVGTALKGAGVLANGDQSPLSWAYNPQVKTFSRDTNGAKALLLQTGWAQGADGIFAKNGKRLSFSLTTTGGNKVREITAQMVVQQMKDIGVEVDVRFVDSGAFVGEVLSPRRFQAAMYSWVLGFDPDDTSFWNSKSIPSASNGYIGQNYPGWRNTEVDNATTQGQRLVESKDRAYYYFRIQELLASEVPVVPLYIRSTISVVKDNVVNFKPNPGQNGNLWNVWEWGLLAKK